MSELAADGPRLLQQPGRIVEVAGAKAQVVVDPIAGCGACAARSGCAARVLVDMGPRRDNALCLPATETLRPGQQVLVSMPASDFLTAATLALLLPAVTFVAAIWLCLIFKLPTFAATIFCVGAVLVSFWPLWRAERSGRLFSRLRIDNDLPPETPE
ncbi:SoxR reducing system RseC family protein [Cognatiyoonia sp. IB215182]|uniref:SoxR reducing system RseC family protein n=1 Tax=Cognatiyoonia sp. IB215182 TaxID=3097353 RepID=UPI002A102A19|nr:SoxR reducing system RseC family protein [Cognatiyoonia sp. IB215182]MDX8355433.1 SoxR reducing system RseC family protein [Cognatiyoonia sp. IB215182]